VLGAITEREDPHDALVLHARHAGQSLEKLPAGSVIGTSSLRRVAQLRRAYPQLVFKDVRGNLNTRLRKLDDGEYDALVLAVAGLTRLGLAARISERLSVATCLHAVGQGAYGIECRADDALLLRLLHASLHHEPTAQRCEAERAFLRELEGGCQVPVAVSTTLSADKEELVLHGAVLTLDGSTRVGGEEKGDAKAAADVGTRLALRLKTEGAGDILRAIEQTARHTA
jgi:hydroxymethylbilane synthase